MIKLLVAPIRSIVRFPLFQLALVVAVILFLQAADDKSALGQIFNGLDKLVDSTVGLFSAVFNVKSFTKSWLTSGFMIAYVYLACLLILSLVRVMIRALVDFVGWSNAFGLRNAIARSAALRLTARGCHSRELGRPTFLRKNGRRHLLGPSITNHRTPR
jgi:hypothetical protein